MRKALFMFLALLLFLNCSQKVTMYVSFYAERDQDPGDPFYGSRGGDVYSDPVLSEMTATINDVEMVVDLPSTGNYFHTAYFWDEDTIPQAAMSEQKFEIQTDIGDASAICTIPGEFDITTPMPDDSIAVNSALDLAWDASDGADWYAVDLRFFWTGDHKDTMVYVDSTTWTVPAGWLDNDGTVYIDVYAGDGPRIETGAVGNVKGAKGFCVATNGRSTEVTVGNGYPLPALKRKEIRRMTAREFFRSYIQEMSKYSQEAGEMLDAPGF